MTRDEWTRVKDIAAGALDAHPSARAAYLTARCGGDRRLRDEVEALLDAADQAADLYETPTVLVDGRRVARATLDRLISGSLDTLAPLEPPALIGRRLGAYRVVSEIGRGGMGA